MKISVLFLNFLTFLVFPSRRKIFKRKVSELKGKQFNPEDPLVGLKKATLEIIEENNLMFFLNSKSELVGNRTIAPFEKTCKSLRKVYRTRLSGILKDVKSNKYGLSSKELISILRELEDEYQSLSGAENIFRRAPCREGMVKIESKIKEIKERIELLLGSSI